MKIKRLKQLSDAELVFTIEGGVPTEEEIQARSLAVNAGWVSALDWGLGVLATVAIILVCNSFYWLVGYPMFNEHDTLTPSRWTLYWAAPLLVGVLLSVVVIRNGALLSRLVNEANGLAPITPEDCDAMLAACEATEEGLAYRDKVVAAGRQFVHAELTLLAVWARNQQQREKCARLYAIKEAK